MDSLSIYIQLLLFSVLSDGTIDVNLPELEYIADHLTKSECRKLIAVLHDPNFDIVNNVDAAERKIPDDVSCLKLLVHWNSQTNEGKGETHVVLTHRLRQLGRDDLADWLSKTVFHQLGQDLNKSLFSDPLRELAERNETDERMYDTLSNTEEEEEEEEEWSPMDVILLTAVIFITSVIVILLARMIWMFCKKKKRTERAQKLQEKEYIFQKKEESESSESSSSVTEFDATAISLMGVKKPTTEK